MHLEELAYEELPLGTSPLASLSAGALAGIAEHTVTYPFDIIKTRMQILHPDPQAVYTGVVNAFRKISSSEGLVRLWRGVISVVIGAGPAHAVYFGSYEKAKQLLMKEAEVGNTPIRTAAAGALATTLSDAVMTPFDVIKQRMQVHGSVYPNVFACTKSVFKKEGIRAFYISYPTTLVLNIPFHIIQFPTYEFFRRRLNRSGEYSPLTHILSGGIAGGAAAALTTPIDVIKTVLQTRGLYASEGGHHAAYRNVRGMWAALNLVYREHGLRAFIRGMAPRVLTHMPATAVCWTTYEYFKVLFINAD